MKRKLFFTTFLMLLCTFVFGQSNSPRYEVSYTGNYSNSMTITAVISFDGEIQNKELELGVFCNNEVRASVMTRNLLEDGQYLAYFNVNGELGDVLTFKVYDHSTNKEWANGCSFKNGSYTYEELSFVEGADYGRFDNPCVINFTTPNYWTPNDNFETAPTTVIAVVEIDEVEQANSNLELGAFCGDECRGSVKTDYVYTYKGVQRHYAMMEVFGNTDDVITFKLYNHGEEEEYTNFVDVNTITLNPEVDGYEMIGSYSAPLKVNFLTKPYVAEVNGKKYQNFDIAFNAAVENNTTIKLLEDITIDSETYTVADGKNVTLDMAGKTITVTDNKTANYELFYIYGGMTVTGNGTIELTSANNRGWNAMSAIFHNRGGVLNVVNGTFTHEGGTDMAYVIDNSGNYYGDATTNINGGTLTSTYTAIRNRMEQNTHGASGKAILNIAGGKINGQRRAIWAQAASTSTTAPATGEINVTGGTIGLIETACHEGAKSMTTVTGGTVAEFIGESGELKVNGGTVTDVTIKTAAGVEVPYAITSEGLYVAAVAEVNGNYYATLQEAVNAANGSEVKVLMDFAFAETYEIASGVTANINLNGFTMTGSILASKANLTIKNGTIINKDRSVSGIEINAGELNLDNVNISSARHAVRIDGDVEATINGGEYTLIYTSGTTMTLHAVNVSGAAEVTIKDGKFVGPKGTSIESGSAVNVKTGAKVTIEGGDFSGGKNATLGVSGTMVLTGGTYDQDVQNYCAPSYICVEKDGKYIVVQGLKGSGTETDPFVIMTIEDLIFFRDEVNTVSDSKYNRTGVYVALGADIDMAGVNNWVGIGSATADHGFMGNFDGKTFKIQNLTITNPDLDSDGYAYAGLFAVTEGTDKDNQNTIKNLTIENVTINTTGHIVSAAIAYPYYTIVDNVKVCGNIAIKGGDYTAGVLAYTRRCVNASNIAVVGEAGSYITGAQVVGGVISDIQMNGGLIADYKNFSAEGITVTGTKNVGGISGIICKQTLDGASVNNVTLTSRDSDVRVGIVSGSWGDVSTISNVTFANVTGATAIIGATYKDGDAVEARIGDTYYATFEAALEAAQAGDEITLLTDIEASEVVLIGKSVVINGNGHKVTSSASRVFRVTTSYVSVVMNDVDVVSSAVVVYPNDIRGIAIDASLTNVELTLNNCSVDFTDPSAIDWTYAVNVAGNGTGHKVTVIDGTYEGANVINVHGANNTIVVKDATLNCKYPNNDMYTGACIWVLKNQGSSVEATGNTFNGDNAVAFNLGTGTDLTESNNIDNTRFVVAKVDGTYYYSVNTAINEAQNDDATVQLLYRTIDEVIAPWAGDATHASEKSITIVGAKDANGNLATTLTGGLFLGYNDGTVRDNTITVKGINFVGKGVTVANQKNVVIEGNKFTEIEALVSDKHANSGSAILIIGSDRDKSIVATVENNVIENVTGTKQAGIYMSQVADATVKGNTVTGTTHNAITISAATNDTILVENNTLSQWGLSGDEGRAMRISGGTTVNVNGNVMSNTAAPEEFVKITGAATIDASANYWNGNTPLAEKMFLTDLTSDPVTILDSYYTDAEKTNLVKLAQSVAKIDTKYYQSFASAIAAVKNGETIELITDCAEEVTIKQDVNKNFTINGNGKTYTGTINVNGNNKGGGVTGAGLTITNVNFVLNGEWQSGILTQKGTYACNIVVDGCSFTGTDAKQYGIRLRSGYNITVKNATGTKLYDFVYGSENVIGFTAEEVTVTESNMGFYFPYGNNLNFKNVDLNVTGTGIGIINRNAGKATFENCVIEAKNAVTLSQNENNAIAYTLEFNGENEFTTSEEWLTVTGTNAVLNAVLNDAELDVTETSGLVANIGNVYYNTLQHAINAAQDGDTVAIANDFTLDAKKYETQNDGYATLVNVKEKAVTIDLNGKTVTVETLAADLASAKGAMLLSVFHADTNGQLTLVDSSADGTGTVNVKVNDAKVYSVFASESQYTDKTNSGKLTVNTGNYTTVGKLSNAMIFSDANEVITINGGTFIPEGISILSNYPWFVNTLGNNELRVVVNGGTFNADINHQYRPFEIYIKKELALKNNGDGTWTIVPAEAYVTELLGGTVNEVGKYAHNVGYATLEEAVEAVNNLGKTVTLLKDVEMASTLAIANKDFTLNGADFTITQAETCNNTIALFDITGGKAAFNNIVFDGIKEGAVVRTVNTEFAMNEVIAQNCEHTVGQGLFRLLGQNTITNSTFKNNTCTMVMTLNYDALSDTPQVVDNCLFKENTVNGTAALYYVKGANFTLANSEFILNNVNCNNNGATVYLGFQENCKVTNNLFKENVVTDASESTRVAGAIFFGYEANISGNAFDNNTATNANGDVLGQVCTSTYYDCEINLDGNYWDTIAPVYGRDYTVQHQTGEGTFVLDSYYTSYTYENDVLTLGDEATFAYVAEVGKFKYLTLAEAAAVAEGKTVTMLANIELNETVVFNGTTTLDLNGKTITGTDNNTTGNFYLINNNRGDLTIVDSSVGQTGAITLTATTERNWSSSSVVVANNLGTVTVKGGTIQHLGGTSMAYGIDNLTNGANTVATLNIEGGNVQSTYFAVRQFANGGENSLNIIDGTVGYAWMQSPNDNANVANISVEGGEVAGICLSGNNADVDLMAKVECVGEVYGTMPAGMVLKEVAGYYTLLPAVAEVDETLYATLQDAVDAADGKTVVVLTDINLTEGVIVEAGKVVTLDLNGNTVTGTPAEAAAYAVINNRGDLTIQGEGSIICNYTHAGSTGYAVNAITNCGTLTIEGATIANTSIADYQIGYAIDNNSTTGNAVVVVKSGAVISATGSNYYDGIRQFCNSLTNENDVTIEGGEVSTLWMQNPSDGAEKNTKDVKGSFSITGGKVGVVSTEPSANFTASITAGEIGRVEYFQEAEGRNLVNYITGGAFKEDPSAFLAENYSAIYDDGIEYYIVKLTSGTQTREFTEGWNWFSSYINLSTSTGLEQLETALGTSGIQIKGRNNQFATYTCDEEGNNCFWFGAPFTLSPTKMYMIKTSEAISAENFEISGDLIDYETTAISLNKGWNWISYPLQETVEINEALENLDAKHNDMIKGYGQNYVATYYQNFGWIAAEGPFNFVPGQGYMYKSESSEPKPLIYSASSTGNNSRGTTKPEASVENNYWRLNASQYANNMVVFGMLSVDGEIMDSEYEIAAFANGECRGSARPFYIEELDKYMVFMTIYGEEVEELTFKCYDVNYGTEYELSNRVNYSNDAVLGSIDEPYMFNMNFLNIEESTLDMINIYPNPTTRDRAINLQATCDNVEVFNALGVKVAEYQNVDTIDALETAGVYVIRVTINGEVKNCRLVVE